MKSVKTYLRWMATIAISLAPLAMGPATALRAAAVSRQAANAAGYEFEVASIKPSDPNARGGSFIDMPGGAKIEGNFESRNMPLMLVIRTAYGLPMKGADGRIVGEPSWLYSERYDIEAKFDDVTVEALNKLTPDERKVAVRGMIFRLLADRCKFAIHTETKEMPIYTLVIAKGGSKLRENNPDATEESADGKNAGSLRMTGRGGPLVGIAVPISTLVTTLSAMTGRTIIDQTGLAGKYDFKLQWSPEDEMGAGGVLKEEARSSTGPSAPAADSSFPPLLAAIQEQLGLKLESGKGPVDIVVIDHIERPSAN